MINPLTELPAVHRLLADERMRQECDRHGSAAVRSAVRQALAAARRRIAQGTAAPSPSELLAEAEAMLARQTASAYPTVINATGVLIHTNLGRAPRLDAEPTGYLALEVDLEAGGRGERLGPVTTRLARYFGAETATVVTNNAAALVLLLAAHAAGREVVVSRGELIEIGGSFRLPEIMVAAGASLREVGCTNRTYPGDYTHAIGENTAAILVVHRSNFHMAGFVSTPDLRELVEVARSRGVPLWVDQGSGCHTDLARYGLRHELTVQEILAAGADVVLFSGDKLLGGPQAGVLVGRHAVIGPLQKHPLRRALRPDKSVLLALAATLDAYLAERAEDIPLYRLLALPEAALRRRARRLASRLGRAGLRTGAVPTRAVLGGGTTPDQTLPSWAVTLPGGDETATKLRMVTPAVVGRVEEGKAMLDLRAVFPEQDRALAAAVLAALTP